tara:strand:+ start:343 stop:549 length:207 start_codon:yes stop_codon:yes gene_type:complete
MENVNLNSLTKIAINTKEIKKIKKGIRLPENKIAVKNININEKIISRFVLLIFLEINGKQIIANKKNL